MAASKKSPSPPPDQIQTLQHVADRLAQITEDMCGTNFFELNRLREDVLAVLQKVTG